MVLNSMIMIMRDYFSCVHFQTLLFTRFLLNLLRFLNVLFVLIHHFNQFRVNWAIRWFVPARLDHP